MTRYIVEHALQGDYLVVRYDNGRRRVELLRGHPRRFPTREAAQAALDAHLDAQLNAALSNEYATGLWGHEVATECALASLLDQLEPPKAD